MMAPYPMKIPLLRSGIDKVIKLLLQQVNW